MVEIALRAAAVVSGFRLAAASSVLRFRICRMFWIQNLGSRLVKGLLIVLKSSKVILHTMFVLRVPYYAVFGGTVLYMFVLFEKQL